ncbi:hypothetical protein HNR23_001734 [Nocardiopsis mwathae]|uniref:Uncharacterized protein n=1 Tax=Nocardiopsis mwathae TaxID=1472723 RepID=A0A7W9YGI2_9ACTN|nr:hypothetical protein [Nocardiopsis mwathae]MBB6171674.1 hypothetical protein [Nocardiopsis mwathae]
MADLCPSPPQLTWPDVDPAQNPFEWDDAEAASLMAAIIPLVPQAGSDRRAGYRLTDAVSALLMTRYGRWADDWNRSIGEGDKDGGVVTSWCCAGHSIGEPEETAARVVDALLEWREWLEELADRFAELAPPPDADAADRSWHLERAAVRLVTVVVDRTEAESGWYGHCSQVLEWFLGSVGVDGAEAEAAVDAAIGGRFESWSRPAQTVVDSVGERVATRVSGRWPYRDR